MKNIDFNPFAAGELKRIAPTTGPQKEVVASAQMSDEANTAFNEGISIRIHGALDLKLLTACFDRLIDRHDILRTTFSRNGNEICLPEKYHFHLNYNDLRHLGEEDKNKEIDTLWQNIALSSMNLEEGPLFFAWTNQLADTEYELTIAAHHIIVDGWSMGLILTELTTLYRNAADTSNLPAADSFFDFADQADAQEVSNLDNDYWKSKFEQLPPVLDLPLDFARPQTRTFSARRYDYIMEKSLTAQLPKAAAGMKASVVNLVMAAYFSLLHRLTGNEDLVVGLPVAGQAAFNRMTLIGHMVQLLPIRINLTGDTIFSDLVKQVKSEILNASEHPNFTFGKLIETIKVDRTRVPLISTIFNIDQPMGNLNFGAAQGIIRTIPRMAENFEIFLNILPSSDTLTIEATYSTTLFSEATVIAWLQSLEQILKQAADNSSLKIDDLRLAASVPEPLQRSNQTTKIIIHPDFISAFQSQLTKTPDAVAVVCGENKLSYRQLNEKADDIADFLLKNTIKEGDIVGICCERSELMLACILGTFKCGAAYLPLDPDFPQDRLIYMLEDAGAVAVIEDHSAPSGVRDYQIKHFASAELDKLPTAARNIPLPGHKPDRLAYIIYTSGSTGKPKGVRVQHVAMINFLESMVEVPGCSEDDRLLAVTTLSFDISVLELYMPLICGATTIIATAEEVRDGEKLAELIRKHKVTILQATPSTWKMLLAGSWRHDSSSIKALCGGEPLPPDLITDLVPRVTQLWNMFGPTETTVWSTCKLISLRDPLITVGKPINNTQVYILDKNQHPLPLSTPGELFIGGTGVTLGYHNRPDLNAEKFIDHPEFGRIYATGDLAKTRPDGEIQHLGRLDDQVKVRGHRIELGEIESALLACEEVSAAAVYLWVLASEDIRIVACCVPSSSSNLDTMNIRKLIRKALPNYMIPQYYIEVDEIPLTPNGKINRKALPKPDVRESTILSESTLVTESEKLIAQIWTELIKPKNKIGRDDNFFELGGHSLLALQAIRKIEIQTGRRITPAEIVSNNLAAIAEKVGHAEPSLSHEYETGPISLSSAKPRKLSAEQMRLLKRQLDNPESTCNNLPAGWILKGDLDLDIFNKSLSRVYERQTALRTIIHNQDDQYYQVLQHVKNINLTDHEDLSANNTGLDEILQKSTIFSSEPFSPMNNILFRTKLYKISNNEHFFSFTPHQLIFDGWSFDIFLNELATAYTALSKNQHPESAPLKFEFRDYCDWSHDRKINAELMSYHQSTIGLIKPANYIKPDGKKGQCIRRELQFSKDDLVSFESFCNNNQLRLHEVLFASLAICLSNLTGEDSATIGMPVSGRYNPDVINLIGSFVSTLPCNITIEGDTFVKKVVNIAKQLQEFLQKQDISLAEAIKSTDKQNQYYPDYIPASFGFQDIRNRPTQLATLSLSQIDMPRQQTELPIEFWTRIQPEGYVAVFDYDQSLLDSQTIDNLEQQLSGILKNIAKPDIDSLIAAHLKTTNSAQKKPLWKKLFQ